MKHLFWISFVVYLAVNVVENLIHYNIGKYSNTTFQLDLPTMEDGVKIVVVMFTFAALQGVLTCILDHEC